MTVCKCILGSAVLCLVGAAFLVQHAPAAEPNAPANNLEYWLRRSEPASSQPSEASQPAKKTAPGTDGKRPGRGPFSRTDAIPGVIEFSDGRLLAGWIYTTRGKSLLLWQAGIKRWRRIPPAAALSITAIVESEEIILRSRWKGMGEPERVYTGRKYPTRRLNWRFSIADGSTITGSVKGQPIWIDTPTGKRGPFILAERTKGDLGTTLSDLVYVRRIVFSRRAMDAVPTPAKAHPNSPSL